MLPDVLIINMSVGIKVSILVMDGEMVRALLEETLGDHGKSICFIGGDHGLQ